MYKVYIDTRLITISSQPDRMQNYCLFHKFHDQKELSDQLKLFLNDSSLKCINIYSYKLDHLWASFVEEFHLVEAAGGIVVDSQRNLLLIKRYNHWDAPKGHFEPSETPEECARREINEECGVKCGKRMAELKTTFHIYTFEGEYYLKKSYWFLFTLAGSALTIAQTEEGITEASWVNQDRFNEVRENMWPSVNDVINEVLLKHLPYL